MSRQTTLIQPSAFTGLMVILAIGLGLRCVYFVGVGGYDDVSYLKYVVEILNGSFSTNFIFTGEFPFRYRAGVLYPTAAMFKLFGHSEYVAAALPLLVSIASIWLAWRAGRLFSPRVGCIAALLMATLPIAVISATSLLPTLFSSFFCGLSIVWWIELEQLLEARSSTRRVATRLWSMRSLKYFAVGLSLGVAYLYRLEASISGVVFIIFALLWWRPHAGWIVAALGIILIIGAENIAYYMLHDEWFYRLRMISRGFAEVAALGGSGSPIENAKSPMVYVEALFVKPTDLGLHGAAFVLAAVAALFCVRLPVIRPVLIWFWVWLLYLSFGTWSIETYVPTTKNPRYLQNVCVPGAVLFAFVLAWLIEKRGRVAQLAGLGLIGVLCGSMILINPAWVYRYENAAGGRIAAEMLREETKARGVDISRSLVQAEHYTAINLAPFIPEVGLSPISFADIGVSDSMSREQSAEPGFLVHDEFVADKYVRVVGYKMPAEIRNVPETWTLVSTRVRPNRYFQYRVLSWLSELTGGRIKGFENSLKQGRVLLYEVGKP